MLKKMLLMVVVAIVMITSTSYAGWLDFDRHGTRIFYGTSDMTSIGPTPGEVESYSWTSASYLLEKDLYSWLTLQTTLGAGYLDSSVESSASVEGRVLFKAHYSPIYFSLGGGLAHLFETQNIPDLADSWIYGIITGEAGIHFIEEENFDLRAGYIIEHISSPLHQGEKGDNQDPGWNVGGFAVNLTWRF
jgi:hypothetical protein